MAIVFVTLQKTEATMNSTNDYIFMAGEVALAGCGQWWRTHIGEYMVVYCTDGQATLTLMSRQYGIKKGDMLIIAPDMFPSQVASTADFCIEYCIFDSQTADKASFDVPKEFFDCTYAEPVFSYFEGIRSWMALLMQVAGDAEATYRKPVAIDLLHAFNLEYLYQWKRRFGDTPHHYEKSNTDRLCVAFYNLMLEHYHEHRDIGFYAGRLCITANYLAIILRRQCGESPKQAIDRQVINDMEYQLRNTDISVNQLARDFHFPDTSYLCRFFRQQTGMSPSEYRKLNIAK